MKPYKLQRLRIALLFLTIPVICGFHWWDPIAKWVGIGNEAMESGDFEAAQEAYRKAAGEAPGDERIINNKGVLEYSRENYQEAADLFETASSSRDTDIRSDAWYNRGCALMQNKDLPGAMESFIEALKANPDDQDAKANLEMALQLMQQMPTPTPQPNQDRNQDDQQSTGTPGTTTPEPDQTAKPDDSSSDGESTPTATMTPQAQSDINSEPTPTPSGIPSPETAPQAQETAQPEPEEGKMSVSEAERLLDAQEEEEMDVRRRFHQLPRPDDKTIEKDW
ncbi:tetratricopeptide repeat protein [bacterium]|nr:tetratricopeptide repeat protein [candidate division CSSED10-310 bacterium]